MFGYNGRVCREGDGPQLYTVLVSRLKRWFVKTNKFLPLGNQMRKEDSPSIVWFRGTRRLIEENEKDI